MTEPVTFRTVIAEARTNATGIVVPARASYEALSYSRQRALVEPIGAAKTPETRARRLAAVLASLTG